MTEEPGRLENLPGLNMIWGQRVGQDQGSLHFLREESNIKVLPRLVLAKACQGERISLLLQPGEKVKVLAAHCVHL